jgi:uncharacterized membrane protein
MNKVCWKREKNGTCVPYIFEEINGHFCWRRYNTSSIYVPDTPNFSKGYLTFLKAKKLGFEIIVKYEDY